MNRSIIALNTTLRHPSIEQQQQQAKLARNNNLYYGRPQLAIGFKRYNSFLKPVIIFHGYIYKCVSAAISCINV